MAFFDMWKDVIMQPKKAFAQMKRPDMAQAAIHIVVAGVIAGVVAAIAAVIGGGAQAGAFGALLGGAVGFLAIITVPILLLIGWMIISVVLLIFAKLLGGKGDFGKHSYMIAMYIAPLFVISTIVGIIPMVGSLLSGLVSLYGLYLLTLAMMYAHGFDMVKAALVWIIPAAIGIVIAMMTGAAFLGGFVGSLV
jgi:hypothetical protein